MIVFLGILVIFLGFSSFHEDLKLVEFYLGFDALYVMAILIAKYCHVNDQRTNLKNSFLFKS